MSTPMMRQYNKLKKQYDDAVLLFRLGDFYEAFNNDAKVISKVLGIVLTGRGKGENRRPMAGIPHHALDNYLPKLVKAGYKVAIAEQLEEPTKGKKIVDRDVVKVITSGTITSEKVLEEGKNNYIACIGKINQGKQIILGLAVSDITTGEFYISEFYSEKEYSESLVEELRRIQPAEILMSKELANEYVQAFKRNVIQEIEDYEFNYKEKKAALLKQFKVRSLKGFGIDQNKAGIIAAGVLIAYLKETQKTDLSHINKIYVKKRSDYMSLDDNTIRNLELVSPLRDDNEATLLSILNRCNTSMGQRKLFQWIISPLIQIKSINKRIHAVDELFQSSDKLKKLRSELDEISDIERILGKIGNESVNARDLLGLRNSLKKIQAVSKLLSKYKSKSISEIYSILKSQADSSKVERLLDEAIVDDPPQTITEGGMFKQGYDKELDSLKKALQGGKEWLKDLQTKEIKRTGIQSLKVKFNKVFGYYIEISKANLDKVPDDYIRKQTLVNAERFVTEELKEKEDMILNADEKAMALEYELFQKLREQVAEHTGEIQELADAISSLDVFANFAFVALQEDYSKPELIEENSKLLDIKDGRHPVVEKVEDENFIPNDTGLDCKSKQLAIITGPNMAGKSTYIRQVALIVLMAQTGSFVPAKSMKFSPVDRIFTRVGASDNLAGGESTFMVEMNETANILNNATDNSLIILDEVGRGTSTYDGVAIAWAVAEYIHEKIGAKTLFATHYHELVDLQKYLQKAVNLNVAIKESNGKVIFLRKIEKGGTDKSYGVHVAQFAGIPKEVISKAKEILLSLEQEGMFEVKHIENELTSDKNDKSAKQTQIPLMTNLPESPVVKELKEIDINKLTPLEALKKLDELRKQAIKKRR